MDASLLKKMHYFYLTVTLVSLLNTKFELITNKFNFDLLDMIHFLILF